MTDADLPRRACEFCPDGHAPFGAHPWSVWVSSERDADGQPTTLTVARADGGHVAESDAESLRNALAAQLDGLRAGIAALAAEYDTFAGDVFPRVVTDLRALLGGDENEATT